MARGRPRGSRKAPNAPEPAGGAIAESPAPQPEAPPIAQPAATGETAAPASPLAPVRVRNLGARAWSGSDFAAVGRGHIPAGGEGVVTRRKAEQLVSGQHWGAALGVGPFEVVE